MSKYDNLSIFFVFNILWNSKYRIALFSIFFLLLAYLVTFNVNLKYFEASTYISPISKSQIEKYNLINGFLKKKELLEKYAEGRSFFFELNEEYLFELFIQEVANKENLYKVFRRNNLIKYDKSLSAKENEINAYNTINSLKVIKHKSSSEEKPLYVIEFNTNDKAIWINTLSDLYTIAVERIFKFLNERYDNFIEVENLSSSYQIEDYKNSISIYEGLLKDLGPVKKSELVEKMHLEFLKLKRDKEILENSKEMKRVTLLIEESPLRNKEEFIPATFDPLDTNFKTKDRSILLILVLTFIGFLLGSISSLLKNQDFRKIVFY